MGNTSPSPAPICSFCFPQQDFCCVAIRVAEWGINWFAKHTWQSQASWNWIPAAYWTAQTAFLWIWCLELAKLQKLRKFLSCLMSGCWKVGLEQQPKETRHLETTLDISAKTPWHLGPRRNRGFVAALRAGFGRKPWISSDLKGSGGRGVVVATALFQCLGRPGLGPSAAKTWFPVASPRLTIPCPHGLCC